MSKGKDLHINRQHITVMLQNMQFYVDVPMFQYLRSNSTLAMAAAGCTSCPKAWAMFRPIADAVVLKIQELVTWSPDALAPLKAFLQKNTKFRIRHVVIRYRGSKDSPLQQLKF